MIFPAQLYLIKIVLMALVFYYVPKKFKLATDTYVFWGILCFACLYGIFIALAKCSPHPFMLLTVNIIWPTLALPVIACLKDEKSFQYVIKVILFVHIFLLAYDLLYAYSVVYHFYFPLIYPSNMEMFSYYGTSSRMNFTNLNTLTFTSPVVIILWLSNYKVNINRHIFTLIVLLTLYLFVLSGRRSIMMMMVIVIPLAIVLSGFFPQYYKQSVRKKSKYLIFTIVAAIVVVCIRFPELIDGYYSTFIKAFDSGQEPIKFAQQKMFMDAFKSSPIFGVGVGQMLHEPYPGRNVLMFQFELTYHLWLAETGIVGFLLYSFSYFGLILYGGYIAVKYKDFIMLTLLAGYIVVLIANATNPVLSSFDFMVSYFLCIGRLNYLQLYGKKTVK